MSRSQQILDFYQSLNIKSVPKGVTVMNPYRDPQVFRLVEAFYNKYYNDADPRVLLLGINPGRWGGGVTGIPFTDPVKLREQCGINSEFKPAPVSARQKRLQNISTEARGGAREDLKLKKERTELSADFIYKVIEAFGGPVTFYRKFLFGAVCPLGFTREGKNMNYYDDPKLVAKTNPFIVESLRKQSEIAGNSEKVYCLGEGKNFRFLSLLNEQHHFFGEVIPLEHPRFIMQYRRKTMNDHVRNYLTMLDS